jgi:F-type H+-transporting ATPase subunit delta
MAAKDKLAQSLARQLFKASVVNGAVSAERVAGVLEYVSTKKVAEPLAVLRAYHRFIATELAKSNAVIEHAGAINDGVLTSIAAALSKKYGKAVTATAKANPALIAGLRINIADDTYESSVAGQLAALGAAV